ncbi:MAG: hypothetical protein GX621_13025, partial [Pirellulaceae bacterium]|nr:hypothetical protein [Pirellulaceae bacterium]
QYCMPCPVGVNIPECLQMLDSYELFGHKASHQFGYMIVAGGMLDGQRALASQCTECGRCVEKCPQRLPIPRLLKDVRRTFEGFFARMTLRFSKAYLWLLRRRTVRQAPTGEGCDTESAGQSRQGVADERAVRERAGDPSRP